MIVILSIGSAQWRCKSASGAAKIADLLGGCIPVLHIYEAGHSRMVYLEKRTYQHDVAIKEVDDKTLVTKSEAEVAKLVKAEQAKEVQS